VCQSRFVTSRELLFDFFLTYQCKEVDYKGSGKCFLEERSDEEPLKN
jgi:hypothetical protein